MRAVKSGIRRIVRDQFTRAPGVAAAYVYGSAGRARTPFGPHSDVDVAVLFARGRCPRDAGAFCLRQADVLGTRLGRDVEVIVLNTAPALLAYQALKTGVRALERDRRACRRMEGQLLSAYWDYLPVRRIVTGGLLARVLGAAHG